VVAPKARDSMASATASARLTELIINGTSIGMKFRTFCVILPFCNSSPRLICESIIVCASMARVGTYLVAIDMAKANSKGSRSCIRL